MTSMIGFKVPDVKWHCREVDLNTGETDWRIYDTVDFFGGKRAVVFSLPGAFTPTCTGRQLPDYEEAYAKMRHLGITHVYCVSVNDSFVMNKWFEYLGYGFNVKPLPDGNGMFTGLMNQLVLKENLGFGYRSWRYSMVVNDGVIEAFWEEPGKEDNCEEDPYGETHPDKIIEYLLKSKEGGILNQKGDL